MEMAEYDEDEDFLKVQEQYFDERLDSLGPDLGKTSFILDGSKIACQVYLFNWKLSKFKHHF